MSARRNRLTLAAITAVIAGGASITPVTPATADDCPDVDVVFARGTGEPPGIGLVGQAFVDSLTSKLGGKSVGVYAVDYPATKNVLHAAAGANDAVNHMQWSAANCPNTRMVLGGYSQGAYVVDLVTGTRIPSLGFHGPPAPAVADSVAAVATFGNPDYRLLGGPLTSLSALYGSKAIDLCNGADPVCSSGMDVSAHHLYVESGMTTQAATFAAGHL